MSNMTILMALCRMEYDKVMTGRGFRALAMTTIKEKLRYPHEVVDRQLAHLPRSATDRAYDRSNLASIGCLLYSITSLDMISISKDRVSNYDLNLKKPYYLSVLDSL